MQLGRARPARQPADPRAARRGPAAGDRIALFAGNRRAVFELMAAAAPRRPALRAGELALHAPTSWPTCWRTRPRGPAHRQRVRRYRGGGAGSACRRRCEAARACVAARTGPPPPPGFADFEALARDADRRQRARRPVRRRPDVLHLGHHRPAQGRACGRAGPRRRSSRCSCWPAAWSPGCAAVRRHHAARRALLPLGAVGVQLPPCWPAVGGDDAALRRRRRRCG